jgi:hypothetical protein
MLGSQALADSQTKGSQQAAAAMLPSPEAPESESPGKVFFR